MNRRTSGLTMVELLIVTVVFMALSSALFIITLISNRSYALSEASIRVQEQTRRALNTMIQELRGAGGTMVAAATQLDFQSALGYDLAVPCPADAICWGARDTNGINRPGWQIRYRLNGTRLLRELLNNAVPPVVQNTRVLASDVSQLTFAYDNTTDTIAVTLQVQRVSPQLPGGAVTAAPAPLSIRIRLRNPS